MHFKESAFALKTNYALMHVERIGKGVVAMIEMADPTRLDRVGQFRDVDMTDDLKGVRAQVRSASCVGSNYDVVIEFGQIASCHCSCPDFGRTGPCKHVLAVSLQFLDRVARPTWRALRARQKLETNWGF